MTAGFFYSKTFKIIATVIISVELIIIITLKVVDLYCDEPGRNSTSNSYSSKSQRSYSSGKKSTPSRSYNTYSNSYDVYNYDDPDDFADDWAEEFDGGNYDGGYDDAYDYWEENYGK